ncbi:MAG: hypothetical protein K5745_00910, partial [Saccharofermentans sp.]|nr:hypothetical protein [Saccharofermentans sp.]
GRHEVSANINGRKTVGYIQIMTLGENRYLVEFVTTAASFTEYFGTFIVIFFVLLCLLCLGIPFLLAIKPYTEYKKAYENNIFKNNLIDSLAHNIKTPLQIIGGCAENIKDVTGTEDKNRYADQIISKTSEVNFKLESILKAAERTNPKLETISTNEIFTMVAEQIGGDIAINGDSKIRVDKEYFEQAVFILVDNALRYKSQGTKAEVNITQGTIKVTNKTGEDKFTPGIGLALADRILAQNNMQLTTSIKGGIFEAKVKTKA